VASLNEFIVLNEQERMVPSDRDALQREVSQLLKAAPDIRQRRYAGIGLIALGDYGRAVEVLTDVLRQADIEGAPGMRIAVRINLADAYRYQERHAEAMPWYEQALALARKERPDLAHFALQHLGKCCAEQGDAKAAVNYLREALAERLQLKDTELIESTRRALRLAGFPDEAPSPDSSV
jgi:tetratricopeptide (TPR) repeat protein